MDLIFAGLGCSESLGCNGSVAGRAPSGGVLIGKQLAGVGPAVAIAIRCCLPTFSYDPIVGLTLLLGFYGSFQLYGGRDSRNF